MPFETKFIQSKNRKKGVKKKNQFSQGLNFEANWYLKTLISEKIEALQSIIMQQITDIYIYHKKNKVSKT